ncbi:DNA-binding protein [Treponema vincentii]|jgi:hypothetical protein|uniref:DNA-binding protein n=1 Tax=Treponema vincentii TaxID=69710 RepID=A0A6P1Y1A8_9SPIR|nr:DNA-binding protein [Treponema vincentii]QHX43588.1 DNA-binding protein [Treponema vincentii]DAW52049.1 MAG TPA: Pyocin activator protein PrtN [Caudoviricetes sp.]
MLYSVTQAAELKNVSPVYLRKWARENGCQKVGWSFLLSDEDLKKFDERNRQVGKPKKITN